MHNPVGSSQVICLRPFQRDWKHHDFPENALLKWARLTRPSLLLAKPQNPRTLCIDGIAKRQLLIFCAIAALAGVERSVADEPKSPGSSVQSVNKTPWTDNPAVAPSRPCTCRFYGKDVMLGDSVCMKTPNGYVKARCSRMLNNTSWELTEQPCDAVS